MPVPASDLSTGMRFPNASWQHVEPEAIGWSKQKLQKAESWSRKIGSISVVVAQWGDVAAKAELASVRKSVLSALIGIAVDREEIDLAQSIGSLGIDDNEPSLTAEEKTATVRDLLQSRSGVYHAALYEGLGAVATRPARHSHKPGTFWY